MECLNEEERQVRKHPNHGYKRVRGDEMMDEENIPIAVHMSEKSLQMLRDFTRKNVETYQDLPIVIDNTIPNGTTLKRYKKDKW